MANPENALVTYAMRSITAQVRTWADEGRISLGSIPKLINEKRAEIEAMATSELAMSLLEDLPKEAFYQA